MKPAKFTSALVALAIFMSHAAFAQNTTGNQQYRIKIEKNINGNKQIIDKTFASKQEMDAYLHTVQSLPVPETPEAIPSAPTPPSPAELTVIIKKEVKHEKDPNQRFKVQLVNNNNGVVEVIEKTFETKKELKAYLKKHKANLPIDRASTLHVTRFRKEYSPIKDGILGEKYKKVILNEETGDTIARNVPEPPKPSKGLKDTKEKQKKVHRVETHVVVIKEVEEEAEAPVLNEGKEIVIEENETVPQVAETPAPSIRNLSGVNIYPNPSQGHFYIEFNLQNATDYQVRLRDINGREVYSEIGKSYEGKFRKDIYKTDLSAGTYLLEVTAGDEKAVVKVAVQ